MVNDMDKPLSMSIRDTSRHVKAQIRRREHDFLVGFCVLVLGVPGIEPVPGRPMMTSEATAASTCFAEMTSTSSGSSPVASSTSAGFRTEICGRTCPTKHPIRYPECSSGCENTGSSKRSPEHTSTTLQPSAVDSPPPHSNFGRCISSPRLEANSLIALSFGRHVACRIRMPSNRSSPWRLWAYHRLPPH